MKGTQKENRERHNDAHVDHRALVIAAAVLGETQVSNAQSPYSYPWCALGGTKDSNALSCYYMSWELCRTTMFGIGGNCVESPYYPRAIDTTAAPFIGEATPSPARPNGWSERVG